MTMITNSSSVPGDPLEIIVDLQACKLGTGRRFTTS